MGSPYEGLYVDGNQRGTRVYSTRNSFDALYDNAFVAYDVRGIRSVDNTFRVGYYGYQPVLVYGMEYPPRAGSYFLSLSDSITAPDSLYYSYYYAVYVDDLDSIVVDALRLVLPDSGVSGYGMSPGELRQHGRGAQLALHRGRRLPALSLWQTCHGRP